MAVELELKFADAKGLKKARDVHKQNLQTLQEKLQKLMQLKATGNRNLKPLVLEGEILRVRNAIKKQQSLIGRLKFKKYLRAGALLDQKIALKNNNRQAFTATPPMFVQGGSPGSKK
jgi:hypothetical protein